MSNHIFSLGQLPAYRDTESSLWSLRTLSFDENGCAKWPMHKRISRFEGPLFSISLGIEKSLTIVLLIGPTHIPSHSGEQRQEEGRRTRVNQYILFLFLFFPSSPKHE